MKMVNRLAFFQLTVTDSRFQTCVILLNPHFAYVGPSWHKLGVSNGFRLVGPTLIF